MNTIEFHNLGEAFELMQTGKKEFFSGFDIVAKTAAYEKMKFGYEQIIHFQQVLKDKVCNSELNLEIEEYKNQLIKFKELLQINNLEKYQYICNPYQQYLLNVIARLGLEMDFIQVKDKPNVGENKILQLESIKGMMKEIALPFKFPQFFQNCHYYYDKIFLYGAPNSGKKYLIEYSASIANAKIISLSISQLIKNQFNQPEECIKQIFDFARSMQPSILLIYDLEQIGNQSLNSNRSKLNIFVELLIELDKQRQSDSFTFLIIGISSYPWNVNPRVLRRFSKRMYIPLPNHLQILDLLNEKLSNLKHKLTLEQLDQLTNKFQGYTCCDISNILQMAYDQAGNINKQNIQIKSECSENIIEYGDILNVVRKYKKLTSQDYINKLEEWKANFDD
ncbi:unnamed protein product (macronuclear) [Paramecium tetraurelia]|uniref:ATPase AAA-type core domain-containing protein n=1 Tax=Paramecium tetraurelia TaxID=5888 RepID=A0C723_PARTE|nr:uncharacterized protein GSPATT00035720001 [Paramecium tetraurelia]CAK66590.1 unnamed protein product [Paramecium tetraurelia]|eukprot:XP_001433987.1 hypothetical protein (macronuclear) [Paramecium tetraurelia strain d4-2]